jgi:hypothetical protein
MVPYSQLLACFPVISTAVLTDHDTVNAPNYGTCTSEMLGSLCATPVSHLAQKLFHFKKSATNLSL